MIGYTRDLLYNLRVAGNIWSLSFKHDIQTWFVTLTPGDVALDYFIYLFLILKGGISGDL